MNRKCKEFEEKCRSASAKLTRSTNEISMKILSDCLACFCCCCCCYIFSKKNIWQTERARDRNRETGQARKITKRFIGLSIFFSSSSRFWCCQAPVWPLSNEDEHKVFCYVHGIKSNLARYVELIWGNVSSRKGTIWKVLLVVLQLVQKPTYTHTHTQREEKRVKERERIETCTWQHWLKGTE